MERALSGGFRWRRLGSEVRVTPDGMSYAYNYYRYLSELYLVEGLK